MNDIAYVVKNINDDTISVYLGEENLKDNNKEKYLQVII